MAIGIPQIGVQLFTLKDEFARQPFATLREVASIGFEGVEFVGSSLGLLDLEALNQELSNCGLKVAGATFEIEELEHDLDSILRLCQSIDCPAVILPSVRPADCIGSRCITDAALRMNFIAGKCKHEGITFLYHTHGLELQIIEGRIGIEWLSASWDTQLVRLEPDIYWVEKAGFNAVDFIRQYGSCSASIHFKDMKSRSSSRETEVGAGIIDVEGVAREAMLQQVEWFIVEQEEFDGAPMESVKNSFQNLNRIRNGILATRAVARS